MTDKNRIYWAYNLPLQVWPDEDDAWCAECGAKLETVRPGKHQHPTCSQAQPLTDEALLRQALEALAGQRGDPDWHTGQQREAAITALRERLGEKA